MIDIKENVELSKYTTFQIGGKGRFLVEVKSAEEMLKAIAWAQQKNINFIVLGSGSNVLISDSGYDGLVIINKNRNFEFKENILTADGGAFTALLSLEAKKRNLGGLEFASGIPGTIGGAVAGNAGAYGVSMSDLLVSAEVWDDGLVRTLNNKDFKFGYRKTIVKNNHRKIILSVCLKLSDSSNFSEADVRKDAVKRAVDYVGANAGSYFKNFELSKLTITQQKAVKDFVIKDKVSTGKIIDSLGFKGKKVGGAMVSPKHANVIVNFNQASAKDVLKLETEITKAVKQKYGLLLEPEIIKIGF